MQCIVKFNCVLLRHKKFYNYSEIPAELFTCLPFLFSTVHVHFCPLRHDIVKAATFSNPTHIYQWYSIFVRQLIARCILPFCIDGEVRVTGPRFCSQLSHNHDKFTTIANCALNNVHLYTFMIYDNACMRAVVSTMWCEHNPWHNTAFNLRRDFVRIAVIVERDKEGCLHY